MDKTSLGDRMKNNYEKRGRNYLTRRIPVILRLDGKAFHTFTKGFTRPYSKELSDLMTDTAKYLCQNIQGAKLCYTQSDEITILLTDFDTITTDAWFDYETSKMNSIASSLATGIFNKLYDGDNLAFFDCRAFNIPLEEIINVFRWRFQDWRRNSIQMLAQSEFSQKQLHKKNTKEMIDMVRDKTGFSWYNDLDSLWKNGTLIYKKKGIWVKDTNCEYIAESGFQEFIDNILGENR